MLQELKWLGVCLISFKALDDLKSTTESNQSVWASNSFKKKVVKVITADILFYV